MNLKRLLAYLLLVLVLPAAPEGRAQSGVSRVVYQYPAPGSTSVAPDMNLIFRVSREVEAARLREVNAIVAGSHSGLHSGTMKLSDDGRTVLFLTSKPYDAGEVVSVSPVSLPLHGGGIVSIPGFTFTVRRHYAARPVPDFALNPEPAILSTFPQPFLDTLPANFPALQPSIIAVSGEDNFYIAPFLLGAPVPGKNPMLEIVNDTGRPFYWSAGSASLIDFKIHPNGQMTYFNSATNRFYRMNSKFEVIDTIFAKGYLTDGHDIQILPNGHILLFALDDSENYDVSQLIGGEQQLVTAQGVVVQELDQDKNVVFNWRGFDPGHFKVSDVLRPEETKNGVLDVTHSNSIEVDNDGNITLSSRCLSEITKINRETGDIMWRFGGKRNQFELVGDTQWFDYQHDFRRIKNGDFTMFDNGNKTGFSRAVEYRLDEQNKIATMVWQYSHERSVPSIAMGSVQRLDNGNTVIEWGIVPNKTIAITEVNASNEVVYEADLPAGWVNYRAVRLPMPGSMAVHNEPTPELAIDAIFPNPTAGSARVVAHVPETAVATLTVVDQLGRPVRAVYSGVFSAGMHAFSVDVHDVPSGLYHVVLTTPIGVCTETLTVTR